MGSGARQSTAAARPPPSQVRRRSSAAIHARSPTRSPSQAPERAHRQRPQRREAAPLRRAGPRPGSSTRAAGVSRWKCWRQQRLQRRLRRHRARDERAQAEGQADGAAARARAPRGRSPGSPRRRAGTPRRPTAAAFAARSTQGGRSQQVGEVGVEVEAAAQDEHDAHDRGPRITGTSPPTKQGVGREDEGDDGRRGAAATGSARRPAAMRSAGHERDLGSAKGQHVIGARRDERPRRWPRRGRCGRRAPWPAPAPAAGRPGRGAAGGRGPTRGGGGRAPTEVAAAQPGSRRTSSGLLQ